MVAVPRPLTKALLKKMFLKVLYEHKKPGGVYLSHGWDYQSIIQSKIAEYFKISSLSENERASGFRAVYELEKDGYIMQDPSQTNQIFKILTEKGEEVVEKSLEDMKLPSIDINQLITRNDLLDKVYDDYLNGGYDSAIFKAFKLLEETVRLKAKLPLTTIGAELMTEAFKPKGGILTHPDAKTPGEVEALHHLMRGAIMWFKNPSSHRTVGYDDPVEVAYVLVFANLLLNMVDQC